MTTYYIATRTSTKANTDEDVAMSSYQSERLPDVAAACNWIATEMLSEARFWASPRGVTWEVERALELAELAGRVRGGILGEEAPASVTTTDGLRYGFHAIEVR